MDPEPFNTTRWTLIGRAVDGNPTVQRAALDELCHRYMPALRAYLVRNKRLPPEEADDVLQGFLAGKILEQGILDRAEPQRGRFRNFLLVSLNHYLVSCVRHEHARSRHADLPDASLDPQMAAQAPDSSDVFNMEWARQLLADALRRMHEDCKSPLRRQSWIIFEQRVLKPTLLGGEPAEYDELVRRLNFKSPREAQNVLVNAKRRFIQCLRDAIADYEGPHADIDAEIQDLQRILSNRT